MPVTIRKTVPDDSEWVRAFTKKFWGAEFLLIHRVLYYPHELPGFIAESETGEKLGLATWFFKEDSCELVTLSVEPKHQGVGTILLNAVIDEARQAGSRRLWMMTTNDNLSALRFYQKRGFRLAAFYRGVVDSARAVKRTIPILGEYDIPIHDELELEIRLEKIVDHPVPTE
jgi:N-acetylglutamate synthase-like GNAT family acetyltransferase